MIGGLMLALWFFTAADGAKIGPFKDHTACREIRTAYAAITPCWLQGAATCGNGKIEPPEFCDPPGGPYGKGSTCEDLYCSQRCDLCSDLPFFP